jgi:poly(A) polymerase
VDPDAVKVIRRLRSAGYEAYLVGGGVRDLLLGKTPKDFDVATDAKPQDVRRIFRNCRVIGRRFRLAHILFADGKIIECATFRRDPDQDFVVLPPDLAPFVPQSSAAPVRLAPVHHDAHEEADLLIRHDNHFGDPHEDAIRRDFTCNGLFYDVAKGEVIDYVGGMADVERRLVRTIGDAGVRFREDPIRILRAIKFSARLDMGIAPDVYDAIVEHRGDLAKAARPRVFEELFRLLRGGKAHRSIYLTWDLGVLAEILPELACYLDDAPSDVALTWGRLAAIDRRAAEGRLPNDVLLLGALLLGPLEEAIGDDPKDLARNYDDFMEDVTERLAVPRRMKERLILLVLAVRKMRTGKLGNLPRREFFADAATLHALDCEARGEDIPGWAIDPEVSSEIEVDDATAQRKRRRRRRRRGGGPAEG